MTYQEQIKSPKWQKKRLEILNLRGFKCEICNNEEKQLHVHHRFYIKGRNAWEYDNDVYQVLCETCHDKHHKVEKAEKFAIDLLRKYQREMFLSDIPQFMELIEEICEAEKKDIIKPDFISSLIYTLKTKYINSIEKQLYWNRYSDENN